MPSNPQVLTLLEEMLNAEKTPEDVCGDCPELLPEVRQRWQEFQLIDAQVRTLLPGLATSPVGGTTATSATMPAPPAAFGRYEVRGTLGQGGFGAVYLGHDSQLNRPVAIKVLRCGATTAETGHEQALQEARRLAHLRHVGIVTVHDVGIQDGQFYLVSDFLDGPDLGRWLRDTHPSWTEAVLVAAAVADALAYAHTRLIVHRDVKPANILLTSERAPILVDFGLALDETRAGGSNLGIVAGTPWYMSPEQAAGAAHRIDGRTDIYSLGVVLYEMLTGRVPFRATQVPELLRQVRDDEPQPPRQLVGEIPPALEKVCLKALAKRQQDRYSTAADFAADLRRALPSAAGSDSTAEKRNWSAAPWLSSIKRHTVGRKSELAELGRAFETAAAGQGAILCVTGEPGIGKTTLLDDFLGELAATSQSYSLARGRCSERLAGTEAYLPLLEALESLLHGENGEAAAQSMKTAAPNWYEQVAPLAAKDSSLTRVLAESRAASQDRLKLELGAFLRDLSQVRPLVLFIDDLHWADASTVDLLTYLGGKCAGIRVLIVLTYRPTDLVLSKHPWGPVKLDLQARGVCRELALEFLTRADLDRYLALEFPGHLFPDDFAHLVHARTEGSPLFMADLLRYLRDQQVLLEDQAGWRLSKSVLDLRGDLPESVRGMIQRKIDQLSEQDRRLLVAASVQGYEFDSAVIARAIEQDAADVEDQLDELDRVHCFVRLVREEELPDRTPTLRYRFVHVLYQNALDATLRPTRRASLSTAVAEALLGHYGEKCGDVAAELALLLEAARDFSRAADYFLLAAQNAARVFANQEAVKLARRGIQALSSLPDSRERARQELGLQITLGPALFATNDWTASDVGAAYTRARDLCDQLGDSPDVFPAQWGLFLFHIAQGKIPPALNLGERLLRLAEQSQDPALFLQAHHAMGPTFALVGDWASARIHLEQAIAYYDDRVHRTQAFSYGGHDPGVCCQSFAAKSLWMLGYPDQALRLGQEALNLARELGHPTSLAHTQLSIAILHQFRREAPETLDLAAALERLASDQGLVFYRAGGLVLKGWALTELGRTEEGIALIRQGFEAGGATRAHWRSYCLTLMAEALRRGGNFEEGRASLAEAMTVAETTGVRIMEPETHRLQGEFLLQDGLENFTEAEACFQRAVLAARRDHAKSLELRATLSLARLWQQQGRRYAGEASLAAIYRQFTEGFSTSDLVNAQAQLNAGA
jgi:predicted ATPase